MPQLKNPFAGEPSIGGSAYATNAAEPAAGSASSKKGGGAWGRSITPTEDESAPRGNMSIEEREKAVKKREAELAAREAALNKKEEELVKAGAMMPKKNWPCRCMPILVHDIAKEIPSNMQSMVKQAYFAWLALVVCLMYQLVCTCIMLGYQQAQDRVGSWFLAIIYLILGAPLSWVMWYRRLYDAAKSNGSLTYFWFFLFFMVHIAFCCWAAVAMPISTERWSFTGFLSAMRAFDITYFIGVLYIVGACLWSVEALWSFWTLKSVYFNFRSSGASGRATQQVQQAAVTGFINANTNRV